jgi:AbrB family looped-hinge helix DNA binding protein
MATNDEKRVIDEKGRVTIPKSIREQLRLASGESVEIGVEDGTIVIRPQVERDDFAETMRGCITETTRSNETGSLTPEDLKADWTSDLSTEH